MLAAVYYLVAAASFSGFFGKWRFLENSWSSVPQMLEGTARRPFVYRQLLPMTATFIDHALPGSVRQRWLLALTNDAAGSNPILAAFPGATDAADPRYATRYALIYGMSFLSLFFALFAIRAVCLELQGDRIAATLTPLAVAILLPLVETGGGYFYDFPELLFLALSTWLALRRKVAALLLVTLLATWNKESFLVFATALFPFIRRGHSLRTSIRVAAALIAAAAMVNVLMKTRYAANTGLPMDFTLGTNARFFANLGHFFLFECNYGVLTTRGFNVLNIAVAAGLTVRAWSQFRADARRHAKLAALFTAPLFLACCYHDELRNLSFLWVTFALVICENISRALARAAVGSNAQPTLAPVLAAVEARRAA